MISDLYGNILRGFVVPDEGEHFQEILRCRNVIVERIVSSDILPDKVYCQEQDEWVLVLRGHAHLEIEGKERILDEGDYQYIAAGIRHRVISSEKGTLWLAIHILPDY